MITKEQILELVNYDPITGIFTSRISRPGVRAGSVMGTIRKSNGYVQICLNRKTYYAHRLAMIVCGHNIDGAQVDHIDGIKTNNSERNLRVSFELENSQNLKKAHKTNSLGILGVSKANQLVGYVARIHSNGKQIHIGTFETIEEAYDAYISEKRRLHKFNTL